MSKWFWEHQEVTQEEFFKKLEEHDMALTGNKFSPAAKPAPLPAEGAERKRIPIWTHLIEYFPDAFLAVVDVSVKGNDQHNPGEPLHWAREKSTDQMNTAMRHMWDHGRGVIYDTDGAYHLAKAIWRLSAELQLTIERERAAACGAPKPSPLTDYGFNQDF